jgi:hypothetical protein
VIAPSMRRPLAHGFCAHPGSELSKLASAIVSFQCRSIPAFSFAEPAGEFQHGAGNEQSMQGMSAID